MPVLNRVFQSLSKPGPRSAVQSQRRVGLQTSSSPLSSAVRTSAAKPDGIVRKEPRARSLINCTGLVDEICTGGLLLALPTGKTSGYLAKTCMKTAPILIMHPTSNAFLLPNISARYPDHIARKNPPIDAVVLKAICQLAPAMY